MKKDEIGGVSTYRSLRYNGLTIINPLRQHPARRRAASP